MKALEAMSLVQENVTGSNIHAAHILQGMLREPVAKICCKTLLTDKRHILKPNMQSRIGLWRVC